MQDPADLTGAALQDQEANVFDDDGQEDARQALEDVQEAGAHLPSVEPTTAPTDRDLVARLARQEELMQQLLNQQAATNQPGSTAHPVIQRMFDQQEAASSRPPSMAGLNAELAAPINGIPGSDATTNPADSLHIEVEVSRRWTRANTSPYRSVSGRSPPAANTEQSGPGCEP